MIRPARLTATIVRSPLVECVMSTKRLADVGNQLAFRFTSSINPCNAQVSVAMACRMEIVTIVATGVAAPALTGADVAAPEHGLRPGCEPGERCAIDLLVLRHTRNPGIQSTWQAAIQVGQFDYRTRRVRTS